MTDREIAAQVIGDLNRALDAAIERADKWRACADQLAAALRFRGATQMGREALAVHERLKAEAES